MKPETIVLVRHGQSEGNVNKTIYKTTPDYALNLTSEGVRQAANVGRDLRLMLGADLPRFFISPFWRTRQTYREIVKHWGITDYVNHCYEDSRLREQEWHGKLPLDGYNDNAEAERDAFGHYYYRFEGGESCADVEDRQSSFMNTLHREFEKENFPRKCVIVTHGMTMRVFIKRFFHLTVEEFEQIGNPKNCGLFVLTLNENTQKYELKCEMRKHELKHKYQFDWNK